MLLSCTKASMYALSSGLETRPTLEESSSPYWINKFVLRPSNVINTKLKTHAKNPVMSSPKKKLYPSFHGLPACDWCMFLQLNRLWGIYTTGEPEPVSLPLVAVVTAGRWVWFHYAKCFVTGYGAIMQRLGHRLQSQAVLPFVSWNLGSEESALLRQDMSFLLFFFGLFFFPLADRRLVHFPFLLTELLIKNVPLVSSCLPGSSSSNNSSSVLTCNQSN